MVNETEFWDLAYRNNAPALLGVLRRYVKEKAIAQDLLHEVFFTAINKRESFTGKGSFEGWLHRIAVNTALMYLRGKHNGHISVELASEVEDDIEEQDNAKNIIEAADFTDEELLAAIDCLPNHHKIVFNMYVMDDFSHKKISAELNISVGTSKSHLARARKKIQQILYTDALNKEKAKNRKRAFILMMPFKSHFIDNLYQSQLSDFKMPVEPGTEFFKTAIREASAKAVSATGAQVATVFVGNKLLYVAACIGTAAICWLAMRDNSPLNSSNSQELIIDSTQHNTVVSDSVISDSAADSIIQEEAPTEALPAENIIKVAEPRVEPVEIPNTIPPVVIKKQIIQRDTVVIRDTIIIQE